MDMRSRKLSVVKVKIKSADGYRGEVYLDDTKGEYHTRRIYSRIS